MRLELDHSSSRLNAGNHDKAFYELPERVTVLMSSGCIIH